MNSIRQRLNRPISRRSLVQALSAAGLSVPLAALLSRNRAWADPTDPDKREVKVARPAFSVAERDRRWAAVRGIMARSSWNLDAIIAPAGGDKAYTHYLTQIGGRGGGADVIFPRDPAKPVYALAGSSRNKRFWEKRLASWIADGKFVVREGEGSKGVIELLNALGLNQARTRIGLAKLVGSRFDPEGLVSATYLEKMRQALPGVLFLPIEKWGVDPGPIDEAAMVKSREEQEAIRRCAAVGEKAIETLRRVARPPAKTQADIWFPAFMVMFQETGEDPTRLSISLDEPANATLGAPVGDPLQTGQIISQEIDATVQGYRAQVNHSIFVGGKDTPGFNYYKTTMEAAIRLFFDALAFIRPGTTTCGALVDHYRDMTAALGAEDTSGVTLHSSGIGNLTRPRLGPDNSVLDKPIVIVPGMTFNFKPAVRMKKSVIEDVRRENRTAQIGEHILVTERGAVRLGKRELRPMTTEG